MTVGDLTIRDIDAKRCPECGARFGIDAAFCPFDGVSLAATTWDPAGDTLVGSVVDKRYEVHEPLGEGGMGSVYRVRHMTLDRMFAMKILRRDLADDQALAARFMQEAKATAAIKHPGVVAITDFGDLDDGTPYIVMELLDGETLATRIRARGPMAPRTVINISKKICEALQASHDAGVVHRDLKPENVFLVGKMAGKNVDEEVRVVDFGAAKVMGGSKLTRPGIVFGTPYYMSPEQAGGQAVDGRADVYSLGVLMYEMLTGTVPFEADTYMGVLTKHMFAAPAKPSEKVAPGVQLGELETVVLRALEKDPALRFASMKELYAALDDARSGSSPSAPPRSKDRARSVAPMGPSTADKIELSVARRVLAEEQARRNRVVVIAAATAAITVLLVVVVVRLLPEPPARSAPASVPPRPHSPSPPPSLSPPLPLPPSPPPSLSPPPPPPPPPAQPASASAPPDPPKPRPRPYSAPPPVALPHPPAPPQTSPVAAPPTPTVRSSPHDEFKDPWR